MTSEAVMPTQIVMDHNGDTRHSFSNKDEHALREAECRFRELTRQGYTAAKRTAGGQTIIARAFDPTSEETVFFPRLVGG
jgi:hypothetical protein